MATILDLPPELLRLIFEVGATEGAQQQRSRLLSLIRVNRHFYNAATPLLYKELSSDGFRGSGGWETGLWARTLLEDGSKAPLVQNITLFAPGSKKPSDKDDDDALYDLRELGVKYMGTTITSTFAESEEMRDQFLEQCCKEHRLEYVLSIVLARLPNLRSLQLNRQADTLWICIKALSDAWTAQTGGKQTGRPLKALRTVIFRSPFDSTPFPQPPDALGVAAGVPSIQTVITEELGDTESNGAVSQAYQDLKPKSTKLKAIVLGHFTRLHNEHLYRLVGSAIALEIFYYHIGNYPWPLFGLDGISAALSQQHDSLRHIAIHCLHQEDLRNMPLAGMDFREFEKLQTLQIGFSVFFGAQKDIDMHQACEHIVTALPSSLKILSVVQCHRKDQVDATLRAFDALIGRKDELAPRLRTLRVSVSTIPDEEDVLAHAKQLFKARRLDTSRDPRVLLVEEHSYYRSGIGFQNLDDPGDQYLEDSTRNAWRRSGIYAYLDARGCEAKYLDYGDKDLPAFM